eukprot:8394277-Alexandrium_andersonii.AAC.1
MEARRARKRVDYFATVARVGLPRHCWLPVAMHDPRALADARRALRRALLALPESDAMRAYVASRVHFYKAPGPNAK